MNMPLAVPVCQSSMMECLPVAKFARSFHSYFNRALLGLLVLVTAVRSNLKVAATVTVVDSETGAPGPRAGGGRRSESGCQCPGYYRSATGAVRDRGLPVDTSHWHWQY